MSRFFTATMMLFLLSVVPTVVSAQQTTPNTQLVDDLLQKNRQLQAQIDALEQQLATSNDRLTTHTATWRYDDDGFETLRREDVQGDLGHGDDHHGHDHHGHDHGAHRGHDHSGHGHGGYGSACDCCDLCCDPHFDCFLPYNAHHGGHGNCDLCDCGGGRHGNHPHGAGHDEHAHGPAYHHSINGYPILHSSRMEFFFVERHIHLRLLDVRGADDGEADELEFEAEIVYALNDRWVVIATAPYACVNPINGPSTNGLSDMKFGVRLMGYNGRYDGVLFGLDITTPTGDPSRDLGGGNTVLAPSVNWVHDFGRGTYFTNILAWEMGVDVDAPANTIVNDFAILHTFLGTADARCFRYLTPSLELNTEATINGTDSGRTVVDLTLGLTWVAGRENEMAVGWSSPLTGDRNFNDLWLFNFIKHL